MNILILGKTGMLGHALLSALSKEASWHVVGTQAREPSLPGFFRIEGGVGALGSVGQGFDYAINCIAITPRHINEQHSDSVRRAIEVNALFVHQLAAYACEHGTRVIHVSTDGVFSGRSSSAYDEHSPADALDVYARTKWLGEVRGLPNIITIRTSLIGLSPEKKEGLLEWFLAQPDRSTVPGFTNHIWQGVTTLQFAELCKRIIAGGHFEALRAEAPVVHFAPNNPVSKYDLLRYFQSTFKKDVTVESVEDPRGAIRRELSTVYGGLKGIYEHGSSIEKEVEQLAVN